MKRLALYVFWDKTGVLRDYAKYYLKNLCSITDSVYLIVNGNLQQDSRSAIESDGINIIERDNLGFDFYAWKDALKTIGRETVSEFDEIILCNCSCYGPLYPFGECFDVMAARACDFWGLYRHPENPGVFKSHLQSYFIVIRSSLFNKDEFWQYFEKLRCAHTWQEAVDQETSFTDYFEKLGYRAESYVDCQRYEELCDNPSVLMPDKLIKEDRFPLLKRKAFTENYDIFFDKGNASHGSEIIKYLNERKMYPCEFIYKDLLARMKCSDLSRVLHCNYILPDDETELCLKGIKTKSIALVIYSYFEEFVEENIRRASMMPVTSTVYVVVCNDELRLVWESRIKDIFPEKKIYIRKQINRGRNESAYWITCRDVIQNSDIVCVVHDKRTPSAKPGMKGVAYSYHCFESLLRSKCYIENVIKLFDEHPEIGLLMPLPPLFSDWASYIIKDEWSVNKKIGLELYEKLNLRIPFDEKPNAPYGSMFWLRSDAMKPLFRYDWKYSDFPEEPIKQTDGTILHALERLYPMIAQEAGYVTATIVPAMYASIMYDNLQYLLTSSARIMSIEKMRPKDLHFSDILKICKKYFLKKCWL